MCNDYRLEVDIASIAEDFEDLQIRLETPEGLPNVPAREDVRITDVAPIVRSSKKGRARGELINRRWSWPGPKGAPVYNFRSEKRNFPSHRCLVLCDGFYEFTDPASPGQKRLDKWLFTMKGRRWFCMAGIWRSYEEGEAFTLLTMDSGPDIAPYHHRQIIPLAPERWADWLDPAVPADDLLAWLPQGSLEVRQVYGKPPAQGRLAL
ncbi:SOS response-associated peptidase [Sphingopyxis sp. 113P3]|uniref:SOS response-associated peptidase n=1 Tax=Sphingopyxis sp. (strain 113P3) TaxID=292913 RepID=UPI0006AD5427|nr:SOS response-associated peptidase [Sphingopyxis sp. 113P3]ALC11327.1 hypothetical protein LH20_05105 [Sphingopyxis sp. 113P3]